MRNGIIIQVKEKVIHHLEDYFNQYDKYTCGYAADTLVCDDGGDDDLVAYRASDC